MQDLLLSKVFVSVKNRLAQKSFVQNAYNEARLLISYVTKLNLENFLLQNNCVSVNKEKQLLLENLVARRAEGEPIAYIIKNKEFYSRNFYVDNRVLIPRPDTEVLIEAVLSDCAQKEAKHPISILELGVGSGCIIITLLNLIPESTAVAIDVSPKALNVCKKNAKFHKVDKKIHFVKSDWFSNLSSEHKFDIIVSNPPYITDDQKLITDYQSINFEPKNALFANNYISYKKIADRIKDFLKQEGALYLEIGKGTESEIIKIYEKANMKCVKMYKDLNQIVRCLKFQFNS